MATSGDGLLNNNLAVEKRSTCSYYMYDKSLGRVNEAEGMGIWLDDIHSHQCPYRKHATYTSPSTHPHDFFFLVLERQQRTRYTP